MHPDEQLGRELAWLHDAYDKLKVLVIACLAGVVLMSFLIVWTGYRGRVQQRNTSVVACERGKVDRALQANGWEEARRARQATADNPATSGAEQANALHAARVYRKVRNRLVGRANRADLAPSLRRIKGAGSFSCEDQYPVPAFLPFATE